MANVVFTKRTPKSNIDLQINSARPSGSALNITFCNGGMKVWTTAGREVVIEDQSLRKIMKMLIKRFPLDALGEV